MAPRKPKQPDWETIQAEYVRGDSAKALAARHGVTASAVEGRAKRNRWGDLRTETDELRTEGLPAAVAAVCIDEAAEATRQQLALLRAGLEKASTILADISAPIPFSAWATGVKALVQTQRLALGLAAPVSAKAGGVADDEASADGPAIIPAHSPDWRALAGPGGSSG